MLQRGIYQVEMNPFEKQIGADHGLSPEMVDHGGIIANPHNSLCILYFDIRRQPIDQSELPKGRYFSSGFTHNFILSFTTDNNSSWIRPFVAIICG